MRIRVEEQRQVSLVRWFKVRQWSQIKVWLWRQNQQYLVTWKWA